MYVTSILYIMTSKIVIKTRKVVNRYGGSIWFYMVTVLYGIIKSFERTKSCTQC